MRINFLLVIAFCMLATSCDTSEKTNVKELKKEIPFIDTDLNQFSPLQLYSQHIIFNIPSELQNNIDSLSSWIEFTQPGGLTFENWEIENIQKVHQSIDTLNIVQPFILDNYWTRIKSKKYDYALANKELSKPRYKQFFYESGINLIDFKNYKDSIENDNFYYAINKHFPSKNKGEDYTDFINSINNSSEFISLNLNGLDSVNLNVYRELYGYNGLFISTSNKINLTIESGSDMVITKNLSLTGCKDFVFSSEVNESTKRIFSFKALLNKRQTSKSSKALLTYTTLNLQQKATTLINNKGNIIPVEKLYKQKINHFSKKEIKKLTSKNGTKYLILPDTLRENQLTYLNEIKMKDKMIICFSNPDYYTHIKKLPHLVFIPPIEKIDESILIQQLTGHISFVGDFVNNKNSHAGIKITSTKLSRTVPEFVGLDSKELLNVNSLIKNAMNGKSFPGCQVLAAKNGSIIFDKYYGHHTYDKEIAIKENSVYDIASLTKIVSTTLMGMKLYEMEKYNLQDSLEKFFPDTLKDYLDNPSTIRSITFQELLIHKSGLPSGFPIIEYMLYTSDSISRFDKYYCDIEDDCFDTPVAENFYLEKEYQDSMWLKLHQIWIDDSKPYKYSDVNMNTMYFLLRSMIENQPKDFDFNEKKKDLEDRNLYVEYLYKTFYRPLEMNSTYYQPTNHISKNRLVPTENESYWRKQLLQGYVHDPNSALHGGIAGNAGVFTTTNDLAILLQMLLNKGVYNNQKYLESTTIDHFTATQPESHRGLGFNKSTFTNTAYAMADSASINTYGHTGFTGTCFWVDPDNEIVYIFLSNRVHPKVNNRMYQYAIRKNVHQVFYDAILE
jgi:CubicO group peptidase (beta-lactamase class C family)